MRRRAFALSSPQRRMFWSLSASLLVSGLVWTAIHWLDDAGRAGDALRQIKPWMLKWHGFAAFGFIALLGSLLSTHIPRAWQAGRNRKNGGFFLGAVIVLSISGIALYYLGDEQWRDRTAFLHLWLGVASPALLVWHIRAGRRDAAD